MMRRNNVRTAVLLGLTVVVTHGCERPGGELDPTVVYDSAGIEVVVNRVHPGMEGGSWSVSDSAIWTVGAREEDPAHRLFNVGGVVRLQDGRVAVANGGSNEVRFFDRDGAFLFAAGGTGAGPGEFRGLSRLYRISGDSLVAMDRGNVRISVLDNEGVFARSFNIPRADDDSALELVGVLSEQWFLYRTRPVFGAASTESGIMRLPVTYYRSALDGGGLERLAQFPGVEVIRTAIEGGLPLWGLLPFGRRPVDAPRGDAFFFGSGDAYEIGLYDAKGVLIRLVRKEWEPRPVLPAHLEEVRAQLRERMPDSPMREVFERGLDSAPRIFSPFSAFVVDSRGVLWVGRYPGPGDEEREWDVFDIDGTFVGSLSLPASISVRQIGSDFLLGVRADAMGVEHVEIYELKRGAEGAP